MFTFLEGYIKKALRMWFHAEGGFGDSKGFRSNGGYSANSG